MSEDLKIDKRKIRDRTTNVNMGSAKGAYMNEFVSKVMSIYSARLSLCIGRDPHQSVGVLDEQHGGHAVDDGQRVELFQHATRAVRVSLLGESQRVE